MSRYGVFQSVLVVGGVIVACAVALLVGTVARGYLGPVVPAAYAADPAPEPTPEVVAERLWEDGEEQGVLKVGGAEILGIHTTSGGLTGYERAMIVAKRINDALGQGVAPGEVQAEQVGEMWVVKMGDATLITANAEEAATAGLTPQELAEMWANEISVSLLLAPPTEELAEEGEAEAGEEAAEEPAEEAEEGGEVEVADWQPAEPYKNKIVPIISVLEGIRIGIARVNGPQSAVNQVQAVAQLETHYKKTLEIDVYVPISTKVPGKTLARVQGVGVTGLGDLRL